jgi:hypothetical protein
MTTLGLWKKYAETAPASRLDHLQFAVSEHNNVLIIGNPLPAIPGKQYWIKDEILLPAGYDFEIKFVSAFIRDRNNGEGETYTLFDPDGNWKQISRSLLVPAKRSAVRLTKNPDNS